MFIGQRNEGFFCSTEGAMGSHCNRRTVKKAPFIWHKKFIGQNLNSFLDMGKNIHVVKRGDHWSAVQENAQRSSGNFGTQKEAIQRAIQIAKTMVKKSAFMVSMARFVKRIAMATTTSPPSWITHPSKAYFEMPGCHQWPGFFSPPSRPWPAPQSHPSSSQSIPLLSSPP